MSTKKNAVINIGSVSVLVIFVLLCLTTFATLSLVSANADFKLTKTSATSLSSYYKADSEAEEILAKVDLCLINSSQATSKQAYLENCRNSLSKLEQVKISSDGIVDYTVNINDHSNLAVSLEIVYPPNEGKQYRLKKWQTVNVSQEIPDETINVFKSDN